MRGDCYAQFAEKFPQLIAPATDYFVDEIEGGKAGRTGAVKATCRTSTGCCFRTRTTAASVPRKSRSCAKTAAQEE